MQPVRRRPAFLIGEGEAPAARSIDGGVARGGRSLSWVGNDKGEIAADRADFIESEA
jgi:hypothetical protein